MGAWGIGLYSGDFARDLKATISAVCRLPLDEESLVEAVCGSEASAAADPADEDHTIFWLVVADQLIYHDPDHPSSIELSICD